MKRIQRLDGKVLRALDWDGTAGSRHDSCPGGGLRDLK